MYLLGNVCFNFPINETANCASRLRFDVVDSSKVSESALKEAGAFGMRKTSDTHVQAIFGPIAESLRVKIDHALKNPNDVVATTNASTSSIKATTNNNIVRPDLSQNANDYLRFINSFGGQTNISKITFANNVVTFYLKNEINLDKEYNVSLFNNSSITINKDQDKLGYDKDPELTKRLLNK